MLKKNYYKFLLLFLSLSLLQAKAVGQSLASVKGRVIDEVTKQGLAYVNVLIVGTTQGTTTDEQGYFELKNVPLGYQQLQASSVGYERKLTEETLITRKGVSSMVIEMKEDRALLNELVVAPSLFKKSIIRPVSMQTLGIASIEKNPGGNRDALKVLQSLPGVASNPGFRNDIIIRGGATGENKFFLDGIEVPVVNHFQTQGASGGSVGIINTDLLQSVQFITSGFSANRGNALSSVVEFTTKTAPQEKLNLRATLGTSDAGLTMMGAISKKTSYMLALRHSYLQFLFKAIRLPFLPTYTDFQFNIKSRLGKRDKLTFLGIGSIDQFRLNSGVNDGLTDDKLIRRNNYILNNIPIQEQWSYTLGANYQHYLGQKSKLTAVLSQSIWQNNRHKYKDLEQTERSLDYRSRELETRLRCELDHELGQGYKLNLGLGLKHLFYTNRTKRELALPFGIIPIDYRAELSLMNYALWSELKKDFFSRKLGVVLGLRAEGLSYNKEMSNPLKQISPRLSLRYALTEQLALKLSSGLYHQIPAYTVLGYKNHNLDFANKSKACYMQASHFVGGLEFFPKQDIKLSVESFYKGYKHYPFSLKRQVSLANLGSAYGVVGNEAVSFNSLGRAYGLEFLCQKKSHSGLYGILAYTLVFSEFKDVNGAYVPSTWDNRHLLTFTGGIHLKRGWELGLKFRYVGGRPYTPYDYDASSLVVKYDVSKAGIFDYTKLNTKRFKGYSQLDIRLDKTWFLKKMAINLYLDVKNVYASENVGESYLLPKVNAQGEYLRDPQDNDRYQLEELENSIGRVMPSVGLVIDL